MRMKMESSADYDELTRRLMNCEMTLEEVDPGHGLLPVIQDTVSIGGQGAIADRENENLGQSDVGVAMLRRVIAREMKALRDGKPLKRSEEHTSELQSIMRISYAVFCFKKKIKSKHIP